MTKGTFPVTYLGVPLSSQKLYDSECKGLVEKISRITYWSSRTCLIRATGPELQLINFVISSIQS